MKITAFAALTGLALGTLSPLAAQNIILETAPPVVIGTLPVAGATNADPSLTELRVTFSKPMRDGSWSWSTWGEENYPETTGAPRYLSDGRTCALPVKLLPGKFYAIWLNSDKFKNFMDTNRQPAVPYLFSFTTGAADNTPARPPEEVIDSEALVRKNAETAMAMLKKAQTPAAPAAGETKDAAMANDALLNDNQRAVLAWTDRQFGRFFDRRTFDGWSGQERADLEKRMLDALKGPRNTEYYQAINTLAALKSTNSLPALRETAFERVDGNNRNRWMCVRSLGLMGDKASVPDLIHLVYHGNQNTHWWAQITLVRLTGQNFSGDWDAWGKWWNGQKGEPPYKPEIIRWWNGQAEPDKLAASLKESDQKFLSGLEGQPAAPNTQGTQTPSGDEYVQQQRKLAEAGDYWGKLNLWMAFAKGAHDVTKNAVEADKWLSELVKGAYLAKFEPVNEFNPKTPREMLDNFSQHSQLRSAKNGLGGASFFRTTKQDGKLIGSFLTELPDDFKKAVEQNPNLKLISIEKLTPEMFLKHEASKQESL